MEKEIIKNDIKVLAIRVGSFPDGITETFNKLVDLVGWGDGREIFGISHGSKDGIVYYSAANEKFEGEAEQLNFVQLTIPAGTYAALRIDGWREKLDSIGQAFCQLMQDPEFDQVTPCIEWYKNADVMVCMVRLNTPVLQTSI